MSNDTLWFLVWRREGSRPFVTAVCSYTRGGCLQECHKLFCGPKGWRRVRKEGAGIEKIEVVPPLRPQQKVGAGGTAHNAELRGAKPIGEASRSNDVLGTGD